MLRVYGVLTAVLIASSFALIFLLRPSRILGFGNIADFDLAFAVMIVGVLLGLPSFLTAALYRARGMYGVPTWFQVAGMFTGQLAQILAIVSSGSVLAVAFAYVVPQAMALGYLVLVDVYRRFPLLRCVNAGPTSWRWIIGEFRQAFPFAVAGGAETALLNLPVLIVSVFVSDRIAVVQWGLTRVVAGLLRALCLQLTIPIAAELGHDRAIGAREAMQELYAKASVLITLLAATVVSGLLAFWPDFFVLWTHGTVPYDRVMTVTLLIGAGAAAPSILAVGFANYSDRGKLLVRSKALQLIVFLALAVGFTPLMGPLGAAIAVVTGDLLIQFGLLAVTVVKQTLTRPFRHIAFLALLFVVVVLAGLVLGSVSRSILSEVGVLAFIAECAIWLAAVSLVASPLLSSRIRHRLSEAIPR